MTEQSTPTPRTDAACVSRAYIEREMDIYTHKFVLADFARTLERENTALREQLAECQAHLADVTAEATRYEGEIAACQAREQGLPKAVPLDGPVGPATEE